MKTIDFIKSLKEDSPVLAKIKSSKSMEEVYNVFKEGGVTDSYEDFALCMTKIKEASSKLSESEMATITGGAEGTVTTVTTVTVLPSAASAAFI